MSKHSPLCENAGHLGSRLVDRRDLLERRIEWRRITDQGREAVPLTRRECRTCMRRELDRLTKARYPETESLLTALPGTAL